MTGSPTVHAPNLQIGKAEITVVCQGWAPLPLAEECPGHDVSWDDQRALYPWAFAEQHAWRWHVHGSAVRTPSGLTMVDTGLGEALPYAPWAPGEGVSAERAYAEAGVDPAEVTIVVLTHLHPDHSGGIGNPAGEPRFPNARHVLHPDDWDFLHRSDLDGYSALARPAFDRLHSLGMLDLDPSDREVTLGLDVVHTPGHTPGHRSVILRSGGETVLLTGDLVHLPVQIAHPSWPSSHDEDPDEGARSRSAAIARAAEGSWAVVVPHFARPFGTVTEHGWNSRWSE